MIYVITCTCAFGLESELKYEIKKLGYSIYKSEDGQVSIQGELKDIAVLNVWLRCANHVLIEVASGKTESFDELFELAKNTPWEEFLPKDARFDVTKISCVRSRLFSKSDCQRIIKKAVVDRLKEHYKIQTLSEEGAYYPIYASIKHDNARMYLDTSGDSLHKRGYRTEAGGAPLKETLAAGILMLSRYHSDHEFADFMCGSGTIVIEAGMMAANIAPGLNRSFAFEAWDNSIPDIISDIKAAAIDSITEPPCRLLGSDINENVVYHARQNAKRGGVENICFFQKADMRDFRSKKKNGIIVVNPPYGERIGRDKSTVQLYTDMRKVWEDLDGWTIAVLCGNPDFQRYFGIKADRNRKLYNGNLLSYLYMYYPTNKQ